MLLVSQLIEFSSLLICCSPKLLDLADLVRGLNLDMGSHLASAKDATLSQHEFWFQSLLVTVMKWSIHRCEIREGDLTGSSLSFSPKQREGVCFPMPPVFQDSFCTAVKRAGGKRHLRSAWNAPQEFGTLFRARSALSATQPALTSKVTWSCIRQTRKASSVRREVRYQISEG